VAQKRERVYFVCFRKELGIEDFSFPEPSDEDVAVEDILLPEGDRRLDDLIIERSDLRLKEKLPDERENRPLRIGTVGKGGQGERVYSPKGHAITLSAFGGGIGAKTGMYLIDGQIRRLHPEECRRLMGFPEGFQLHERSNVSYKQFGNSVSVPVVREIFKSIEQALETQSLQTV
jgi:DNA (cytosine-5)-methyltransferase 1